MPTAICRAALAAALASLALAVPAQARTIRCAPVHVSDPGPAGGASAYNVRATGLSCRTARNAVRKFLCTNRAPRGWRIVGQYRGLRNGRWLIRFTPVGGPPGADCVPSRTPD